MRPVVLVLLLGTAPALADPPRLWGIVTNGTDRIALLGTVDGGTRPAQEGDSIDGFTIRSISPDHVVLQARQGIVELQLGPSRGAPAAADRGGATFGHVVNPPAPAPD